MSGSRLLLNGRVIWSNPEGLGHFGIKLRKQIREDEIIERIDRRYAAEMVYCAVLGAPWPGHHPRQPHRICGL